MSTERNLRPAHSIVIPCHNEANRLQSEAVISFVDATPNARRDLAASSFEQAFGHAKDKIEGAILVECLLTAPWVTSPSPGHFRYLIYLGPVIAVSATIGFNAVWEHRSNRALVATLVSMWLLFAAFGTFHHNYYAYHHQRDLLTLAAFVVLGLFRFSYALGPKQAAVIRTPGLYRKTIDEAPLGALIVWDNHYGEHPIFKTDLPADVVLGRKDLRTLHACEGL